jgi:hypothetical protein
VTDRRQFLALGLAASGALLVVPRAASAATPALATPAGVTGLYKVLYDVRFPGSVAYARRASAQGHAVHAIEGDMTQFWYDDLYHRWRQGPAAIAGLTAYGALFCLERLAWDQRMRVVSRTEHANDGGETLFSWVIAPVARA